MHIILEEMIRVSNGSLVLMGNAHEFDFDKRGEIYDMKGSTIPFQDKNYKILEVEVGRGGFVDTGSKKRFVAFRVEEVTHEHTCPAPRDS